MLNNTGIPLQVGPYHLDPKISRDGCTLHLDAINLGVIKSCSPICFPGELQAGFDTLSLL